MASVLWTAGRGDSAPARGCTADSVQVRDYMSVLWMGCTPESVLWSALRMGLEKVSTVTTVMSPPPSSQAATRQSSCSGLKILHTHTGKDVCQQLRLYKFRFLKSAENLRLPRFGRTPVAEGHSTKFWPELIYNCKTVPLFRKQMDFNLKLRKIGRCGKLDRRLLNL